VRSFQAPAGEGGAAPPPRLFQGYDDPERFYWVTQWTDYALYLAGVPAGAADDWLDEVRADELERLFFTALGSAVPEPSATAGGALLSLDGEQGGAAAAFAERLRDHWRAEPGATWVALYQARDRLAQYLVLCGWESEHARQRFYAEVLPRYEAMVREQGGQIEPFIERTLVDVDRYPREASAARSPMRTGRTPTD
jgi:hypothetical protein